jgi:hypothetical protein
VTTASRRLAAAVTDAACRTLGRRTVVRAARYVLFRARLDYPNEMTVNGGSALQRWVLDLAPGGEVLDQNRCPVSPANMDKCRDIGEPGC